jgi:hypothetical protein
MLRCDVNVMIRAARRARGNLVPDAHLAALVIESGSEWITTDLGYARFPGLRWRHPLEARSRRARPCGERTKQSWPIPTAAVDLPWAPAIIHLIG